MTSEIAKFYGGRALKGSPKQKKWAESIRANWLKMPQITDNDKTELMEMDGWIQSCHFWINNRENLEKINIKNLKEQLTALRKKEREVWIPFFQRIRLSSDREKISGEIKEYMESMPIWIPSEFHK